MKLRRPIRNALTNAAVILCLLATSPILLWIYAFIYGGSTSEDRAKWFASFFPSWLLGKSTLWSHGPPRLVWIQAGCSVMALVSVMMAIMDAEKPGVGRRVIHLIVLLSSLLTILLLLWFSL